MLTYIYAISFTLLYNLFVAKFSFYINFSLLSINFKTLSVTLAMIIKLAVVSLAIAYSIAFCR